MCSCIILEEKNIQKQIEQQKHESVFTNGLLYFNY